MKTHRYVRTALALAVALAFAGCAQMKMPGTDSASQPQPQPEAVVMNVSTASAVVEQVDQKTRLVTLKQEDGHLITVKAGPDVRNLAQLRKGDRINMRYQESLALKVLRKGEAAASINKTIYADSAELGDKPAATATETTTVVTSIVGVDTDKGVITLRDPNGIPFDIKMRDPSRLNAVKVGDMVEATYTQALLIEAVAQPKAASPKKK